MVNQTKQRKMRRSTSKKTKSRTRKHVNSRVSRINKMRGGENEIELVLAEPYKKYNKYIFVCTKTTEAGKAIGFHLTYRYELMVDKFNFPLKYLNNNDKPTTEYKTDEYLSSDLNKDTIDNVYTFRDVYNFPNDNKPYKKGEDMIKDIYIKNYTDACRQFTFDENNCKIIVAQDIERAKTSRISNNTANNLETQTPSQKKQKR